MNDPSSSSSSSSSGDNNTNQIVRPPEASSIKVIPWKSTLCLVFTLMLAPMNWNITQHLCCDQLFTHQVQRNLGSGSHPFLIPTLTAADYVSMFVSWFSNLASSSTWTIWSMLRINISSTFLFQCVCIILGQLLSSGHCSNKILDSNKP